MKVRDIVDILDARLLVGEENSDMDINSACGADLMSDVLADIKENVLLLTGLVNPQVIRTAEMMDIKVIAFVRGKQPDLSIVNLAKNKGVSLITTKHPMFIACGKLYNAGLTGKGVWE